MKRYKKPEPRNIRGICVKCGENEQSHVGGGNFRALCLSCHKERYPAVNEYYRQYMKDRRGSSEFVDGEKEARIQGSYTRFKKDYCEKCGFKAEHKCQLDVDHADGDKSNNSEENLKTLCANCHRLKTHTEKNFRKRRADKPLVTLAEN